MEAGVGVLVGLLALLRLTGSSSSPREKNAPLLALLTPPGPDPRLRRSEAELEAAPVLPLVSRWSPASEAVRVLRLS